jgi:hypothetical protein
MVARYKEPAQLVQRVCDHPGQISKLQKEITDYKSQQFLPHQCNHCEIENQIRTRRDEQEESRGMPAVPERDEDLRQELVDMT